MVVVVKVVAREMVEFQRMSLTILVVIEKYNLVLVSKVSKVYGYTIEKDISPSWYSMVS